MAEAGQISSSDPRLLRCGFAKLQGDDGFEFFLRKYETLLGRRSSSAQADVVLGDNMNTSRKHASITYNFEKGVFELRVLGKNGVSIDGVLFTPNSSPAPLASKVLLTMGDREFYFLLPKLPGNPRARAKAPKRVAGQDAPTAAGFGAFDMNQEPPPEPQAQQHQHQQQQQQAQADTQPRPQPEPQPEPQPQPQTVIVVQQQPPPEQHASFGQPQPPQQSSNAPFGGMQAAQLATPSQAPTLPAQPTPQQHVHAQELASQPAQQPLQQPFQAFASTGPAAADAAQLQVQQQALLQQLQWQRMQQWQNGISSGLPAFGHQQQQQPHQIQQQAPAGNALPQTAALAPQGMGFQTTGSAAPLDVQQQHALLQQLQASQQRQQQAALLQQLQASQQHLLQQHQQQQLQQPQPQQQQQQGAAAGLQGAHDAANAAFLASGAQHRLPDQQ